MMIPKHSILRGQLLRFSRGRPGPLRSAIPCLAGLLISCVSPNPPADRFAAISDGHYDNHAPLVEAGEAMGNIIASVIEVATEARYDVVRQNYQLHQGRLIRDEASPTGYRMGQLPTIKDEVRRRMAGAGVIVSRSQRRVGVVTSLHIVDFPDTNRVYRTLPTLQGETVDVLSDVGIRQRRTIAIISEDVRLRGRVLATEPSADLVFLSAELDETRLGMAVTSLVVGDSEELDWGDFVYIVGFPSGQAQITSGLVSPLRHPYWDLVDAVVNRGFSGGPVIAIRDGSPNFEWVGVCRSVQASTDLVLTPISEDRREYPPGSQYQDDIRVGELRRPSYGLTYFITMKRIRQFLAENMELLRRRGHIVPERFWK